MAYRDFAQGLKDVEQGIAVRLEVADNPQEYNDYIAGRLQGEKEKLAPATVAVIPETFEVEPLSIPWETESLYKQSQK